MRDEGRGMKIKDKAQRHTVNMVNNFVPVFLTPLCLGLT